MRVPDPGDTGATISPGAPLRLGDKCAIQGSRKRQHVLGSGPQCGCWSWLPGCESHTASLFLTLLLCRMGMGQ